MPSVSMLSEGQHAEYHYAESHAAKSYNAECYYVEGHNAEYHYAEYPYAGCHFADCPCTEFQDAECNNTDYHFADFFYNAESHYIKCYPKCHYAIMRCHFVVWLLFKNALCRPPERRCVEFQYAGYHYASI